MKVGLIARCEYARGLAIQTKNMFDNFDVDRVLLVRRHPDHLDCDERPEWYPGATEVQYDHINHTLPQEIVMDWLQGLDVVFTVETPYDWRLPDWARSMHVRTVIQGNPEFYRLDQPHLMPASLAGSDPMPTAWWWPTPWRTARLPQGSIIPVPMPDIAPVAAVAEPRFLHVVGKRAFEDRNGTDVVINSLRSIGEPCDFTINGFGWELPQIGVPINSPVRLLVEHVGVEDRWSMYRDQSILVLPRRYGGLSLPALEAAACSPNEVLASGLFHARDERTINLACGPVHVADTDFAELGRYLSDLARDPERIHQMQEHSLRNVPRWSEWRDLYREEFERVCQQ